MDRTMQHLPDPRVKPTITVEEAGEILGIARSTAYAAAQAGQLPTIRIGRRLLVPTAALLGMLGIAPGAASCLPEREERGPARPRPQTGSPQDGDLQRPRGGEPGHGPRPLLRPR